MEEKMIPLDIRLYNNVGADTRRLLSDTVQQISANMYGKGGEMIQFLIKNFKS
jgi:hypothetical protein